MPAINLVAISSSQLSGTGESGLYDISRFDFAFSRCVLDRACSAVVDDPTLRPAAEGLAMIFKDFLVFVVAAVLIAIGSPVLGQTISPVSAGSAATASELPAASATRGGDQKVRGRNTLVFFLLLTMTAIYLVQGIFAFFKAGFHDIVLPADPGEGAQVVAQRLLDQKADAVQADTLRAEMPAVVLPAPTSHIRREAKPLSLLRRTFSGGQNLSKTWLAGLAILLIPFLLSWIPNLPKLNQDDDQTSRFVDIAAYFGCVSLITVLITVELTLLFDLRNEGKRWQTMLVTALGLDIVSLFLLTSYIEAPTKWHTEASPWTAIFMAMTAFAALLSSFVIVLFSKSANEHTTS